MILMAIASNSSEVVGIIASLALLAPLVRALHKWHIDVRKTSQPAATATVLQSQSSTVVQTRSEAFWFVYGFIVRTCCIIYLVSRLVSADRDKPATVGDVALLVICGAYLILFDGLPKR